VHKIHLFKPLPGLRIRHPATREIIPPNGIKVSSASPAFRYFARRASEKFGGVEGEFMELGPANPAESATEEAPAGAAAESATGRRAGRRASQE